MCAKLKVLPPAAKYLKKLKDKKLKDLYKQAIDAILADHTIGESKQAICAVYIVMIYTTTRQTMNLHILLNMLKTKS